MQALRRFEVEVVKPEITDGSFTPGADYRVLALDQIPNGEDCCPGDEILLLLLADDNGELIWVLGSSVIVTRIK